MKRLISAAIALSIMAATIPAFAADEPGRANDPASAEKTPPGTQGEVPKGPQSNEPGRSNDPASADKTAPGTKGEVAKTPQSTEPGRSGDPASAEKQK